MSHLTRRAFLAASAGAAVSATAFTQLLDTIAAAAKPKGPGGAATPGSGPTQYAPGTSPWGPLRPVADQHGVEHLALPPGFSYRSFGATGDLMSDGTLTPQHHDGMAAFRGPRGTIRLVRNHEINASRGSTPVPFPVDGRGAPSYDPSAKGGTVTIDYDPRTGEHRDFVSLTGTIYNCNGGVTHNGKHWITCEETTHGADNGRFDRNHGFCFLVPVDATGPVNAQPIVEMGRFNHEAAVVDRRTGIVYLTEDRYGSACGFYRFVPKHGRDLTRGGTLQMLAIKGQDHYDCRKGQQVGKALEVRWVTIPEPDAGPDDPGDFSTGFPYSMQLGAVAGQGFAQGAAAFDRLEGAFAATDGSIFFVSTSGGSAPQPEPNAFRDAFTGEIYYPGYGQIWQLVPHPSGHGPDVLRLVYESTGHESLDAPDNLTPTPGGGMVICEDDTAWTDDDRHPLAPDVLNPNRLVVINKAGDTFELAVQLIPQTPDPSKGDSTSVEFAGACFSPDGDILFVNLYGRGEAGTGRTLAITGPWAQGGC